MSKTKHLNIPYNLIRLERYIFLNRVPCYTGYRRSIFENSEAMKMASGNLSFYLIMQKDLSDWVDVGKIRINSDIIDQIHNSIIQK